MAFGLQKNWYILITAAHFALPFCHILFLVLLVILVYRSSLDPPETGAGTTYVGSAPPNSIAHEKIYCNSSIPTQMTWYLRL